MEIDNNDMKLICDALFMMSDVQKYKKRNIKNLLGRLEKEIKKSYSPPKVQHNRKTRDAL